MTLAPIPLLVATGFGTMGYDISDPVYLLQHLFLGGLPPKACADSPSCCLTIDEIKSIKEIMEEREFGRRVAGLWSACEPDDSCFPVLVAMLTADGGYVDFDDNDFAINSDSRHHTGSPGWWVREGERTIRASFVEYAFRDDGTIWGVSLQTALLTFDEDFNQALGTYCQEHFRPGQDLNVDDPFQRDPSAPVFVQRMSGAPCN